MAIVDSTYDRTFFRAKYILNFQIGKLKKKFNPKIYLRLYS